MEWSMRTALWMYGGMCVLCAISALLLPIETRGREMAVSQSNAPEFMTLWSLARLSYSRSHTGFRIIISTAIKAQYFPVHVTVHHSWELIGSEYHVPILFLQQTDHSWWEMSMTIKLEVFVGVISSGALTSHDICSSFSRCSQMNDLI